LDGQTSQKLDDFLIIVKSAPKRFNGLSSHDDQGNPLDGKREIKSSDRVAPISSRSVIIGDWVVIDAVASPWGNDPRGQSMEFNLLGQLPFGGTHAEYVAVDIERYLFPPHTCVHCCGSSIYGQ
jgi:hypothetical protein